MNRRTYLPTIIALFSILLLCAPAAWAQDDPPPPAPAPVPDVTDYQDSGFGMDASVYGILNFGAYDWGVGFGAQFAYPILPNGFIPNPKFRDAFHIEGGLDFIYWDWGYLGSNWHVYGFIPQVGVRWAVYVLESLAPFVAVKFGLGFESYRGTGVRDDLDIDFYYGVTVGILWDLHEMVALRAELGYSWYDDVIRIGVLFRL